MAYKTVKKMGVSPITNTVYYGNVNEENSKTADWIKKKGYDDYTMIWIPVIMAVIGGILGAVGMGVIPDFPATDYITAVAVGMFNGLSATGVNQVIKQTVQKE